MITKHRFALHVQAEGVHKQLSLTEPHSASSLLTEPHSASGLLATLICLVLVQAEGVHKQLSLTEPHATSSLLATLICFVLVHRATGGHAFCSRYDFGPWPLLGGLSEAEVHPDVLHAFSGTRAVMLNGFVFDELSADVVRALANASLAAGAAVFFDPGVLSSPLRCELPALRCELSSPHTLGVLRSGCAVFPLPPPATASVRRNALAELCMYDEGNPARAGARARSRRACGAALTRPRSGSRRVLHHAASSLRLISGRSQGCYLIAGTPTSL